MADATSVIMTLKELLSDEDFMEKVESTGRLIYNNSALTIDTHIYFLWGTIILAVLLGLAYLIFGDWSKLDLLGAGLSSSGSSGYGAPSSSYGTAYNNEEMINDLQQQVADLETRLAGNPSGISENAYNSFDYSAAGYSS